MDFDDDGNIDLISGSYDPGTFHLFRGLGRGEYAAVETILDKSGKPVLTQPDQQQPFESFGSWIAVVDWDHDGDLDLLLGTYSGEFRIRLNEGTRGTPEFATDNLIVACGNKPAKLPKGHATPGVVDWDGDGLWDILTGCEDGGVYWLRNVGRLGEPKFAAIENLIPPHQGVGEDEWLWPESAPCPGIRSQVFATDFNLDGKVDLLLGDFCTNLTVRPDLSDAERAAMDEAQTQREEAAAALRKFMEDLRSRFEAKYPGEAAMSNEATQEWTKAYRDMTASHSYVDTRTRYDTAREKLNAYFVQPETPGMINAYATCHGYVWLFQRK